MSESLNHQATIATVEARHASYLNLLIPNVPFPAAFDTLKAPRAICKAVQAENGGVINPRSNLARSPSGCPPRPVVGVDSLLALPAQR